MQLRMIRAASMPAALREVREQLGEDALILSSRKVSGGIEVTAAVAPSAEPLPPPLPPLAHNHDPIASLFAHRVPPEIQARLPDTLRFETLPLYDRPVLFTGPPGAGKTLTVAKLATKLVVEGQAPMVITTDGNRAGAIEQLAAFTHLLDLDLLVAPDPAVLSRALQRREGEPVLIDGSGIDALDPAEAASLQALVRAADAHQVLVLPANLDAEEAACIARAHARLGARHLIPTRLDQARRIGAVLAAASQGLAVAGFGTGPGAADGLHAPDPNFLAARLAVKPPTGVFA